MFQATKLIIVFFALCSFCAGAEDVFEITGEDNIRTENDIFNFQEDSKLNFAQRGKIIIMNKITANSREFLIGVGEKVRYGNAEVELHKCAHTEFNDALLFVSLREIPIDNPIENDRALVFRGWIFAGNPSLSSPTHSVYQLIAVSCS
ncbi:MAG: DUF2155 domain-containing protein [Rickettsiaceae bacterium]|nr:DUF2155 domain-containing protein [Rickettsiaceae bacterium]